VRVSAKRTGTATTTAIIPKPPKAEAKADALTNSIAAARSVGLGQQWLPQSMLVLQQQYQQREQVAVEALLLQQTPRQVSLCAITTT
jgi:hypothetical protein